MSVTWDVFKASPTTIKFGLHAMKQMFGEAEIFPKRILKHSFDTKLVIYHLLESSCDMTPGIVTTKIKFHA